MEKNMYVCICNAVNEARIKQAVQDGVLTWKELCHTLNIANQCGKCAISAKTFFDQQLLLKSSTSPQHK